MALGVLAVIGLSAYQAMTLMDKLPNKLLISLYGVILSIMIITSILRYKRVYNASHWGVLIGAILFGISDNILAYYKFNNIANRYSNSVVMITYYASQFLLSHYLLLGMRNSSSKTD